MYKTDFYWTWDKTDDEIDAVFTVADALRDLRERSKSRRSSTPGLGISCSTTPPVPASPFASACNFRRPRAGPRREEVPDRPWQNGPRERPTWSPSWPTSSASATICTSIRATVPEDVHGRRSGGSYRDGILEQRPTANPGLQCDVDHPTQCMADMLHVIHYFGGVENLKGKRLHDLGLLAPATASRCPSAGRYQPVHPAGMDVAWPIRKDTMCSPRSKRSPARTARSTAQVPQDRSMAQGL